MPNKIEHKIPSFPKHIPEVGDIYRSGFTESNDRYILSCFIFSCEEFFILVSLTNGGIWNSPTKDIEEATKDAIFVGRNMTITLS